MNSFLCRVMVFVFLVNCLTPSLGWGQTSRRRNSSLEKRVEKRVNQAEKQNTPGYSFAKADTATRNEHNKMFAQADQQARENQAQRVEQKIKRDGTQVSGSTRVVRPAMAIPLGPSNAKNFLSKVANDEISFDKLIDYADPMNPAVEKNDLLTSTYATEIIGNTASQLATLQDQDLTEFYGMLPEIESRLLYRMMLLGFSTPSYTANPKKDPTSVARLKLQESITKDSLQKTIAVGTLRLALLKINQFYQAKGKVDPADDYQAQIIASQLRKKPAAVRIIPEERRNTLTTGAGQANEATIQKQAAAAVKKNGNLADFQRRFLQELRQAKGADPEQGTTEFYNLQLLAEYATTYTLEYAPNQLRDIVKIFDEGVERDRNGKVKPGDYQRDYAPILNAVFSTIFENTRYSAMSDAKTKQVLNLLVEFSDPEKYSLPTRVFALEAASLLYRPFNEQTLTANQPAFATFSPFNLNTPDEKLRQVFAQRVVALYCPLTNESVFGVQDYGLDSKQMQALADKLAYIYDGFYDISTAVISMPGKDPHHQPATCRIAMKNQPNRAKKNAEDADDFFWWTANTLFFIYGGETFQLLGTAFRLTRGAVAALPRAGKAFGSAIKEAKVTRFNQALQQGRAGFKSMGREIGSGVKNGFKQAGQEISAGARKNNFVFKLKKQQGVGIKATVEVTPARVETKTVIEDGVEKIVETEIPAVEKEVTVSTMHQLEGEYSWWNPKRWFGMKPWQRMKSLEFTRIEPNFKISKGTLEFDKPIRGLRSMEDIEKAMSRLKFELPDGSLESLRLKPYWTGIEDMRRVQFEQSAINGLEKSFKKTMDIFVPVTDLGPEELFQIGNMTFKVKPTPEMIAQHTKWWPTTRWGNPYTSIEDLANMPIYIAPRSAKIGLTPVEGGLADIPNLLPGFRSTMGDFVSGQWKIQAFKAFFKPMNVQAQQAASGRLTLAGKLSWGQRARNLSAAIKRTFLPDYVPTETFYQAVKTNPMLGVKMMPNLLWRTRFVNTTAFFAAWYGLDYGAYPVFNWWLTNEQQKDVNKELAKYGDAFDPNRAKADELLRLNMGDNVSNQRDMHNSYPDVTGNLREQRDGASLTAVIVGTGRALGMKFVDDATKAYLARTAHQSDFVHAQVRQMHIRMEQNKKINEANDKFFKEQRQEIGKAKQQMLTKYADGFAALPKAKEQLIRLYDNYANEFETAAFSEQDSKRLNQRFDKQLEAILTEVAVWDGALKQAKQDIAYFKKTYKDYPGVFTAREQKLVVSAYTDYVKSSAADDKRLEDLQAKLQLLAISLFESAQEKYPEKQAELEKILFGEK